MIFKFQLFMQATIAKQGTRLSYLFLQMIYSIEMCKNTIQEN